MLDALGYTVLAAATPEEALRLARDHVGEIHLVLSDVVMPGMNGPDLVKQVVAHRPAVKRLFMSGYAADVVAQRGLLENRVPFLHKPFAMRDLGVTVREALDSESEGSSAALIG
jgi:DNA-binding NtrC family response regulator